MYSGDSFFTLGTLRAAGLLLVAAALVWLTWRLARWACRGGLLRRLLTALAIFWAFLWLSPQVYYLYYMATLPDLPLQWVIGWPPSLERVGRLLIFQGPSTLAAHGQGHWDGCCWSVRLGASGGCRECDLIFWPTRTTTRPHPMNPVIAGLDPAIQKTVSDQRYDQIDT